VSTVLVTGLRGFIGKHCLDELIRLGYEVHGVTREQPSPTSGRVFWHRADLLIDREVVDLVQKIRAQRLLHLAWFSGHPAFWTSAMNLEWLRASLRLIKSFVEAGGERVVVSGSCAEYELPRAGASVEEDAAACPPTLYGKTKAALHTALHGYSEQTGLSLGWARTFFVYGPGEPPTKLISTLIRNGQADIREPDRRMDYVSVKDVGRALALFLGSEVQGTVNIGSGKPTTTTEIQQIIFRLLPKAGTIRPAQRPGSHEVTDDLYADTTRLRELLGFSCRVGLDEGISEMITQSPR
jgi:nucleoside-diphosphate-sugar epimerase